VTTSDDLLERGPSRTRTYVLVLVCHAAVVSALWAFGRYFSY